MTETRKKEIQYPNKSTFNKESTKNEKTRPKALNPEPINLPYELNPNIRYSERDDKLKNLYNQETIDLDTVQSVSSNHSKNKSGNRSENSFNGINTSNIFSPRNIILSTKHNFKNNQINFKYQFDLTPTKSEEENSEIGKKNL